MSKNFHRDYADSVGHFCQSIPPDLAISSQEVDTYFRACTLCLWAASGGGAGEGGGGGGGKANYTPPRGKISPGALL